MQFVRIHFVFIAILEKNWLIMHPEYYIQGANNFTCYFQKGGRIFPLIPQVILGQRSKVSVGI